MHLGDPQPEGTACDSDDDLCSPEVCSSDGSSGPPVTIMIAAPRRKTYVKPVSVTPAMAL